MVFLLYQAAMANPGVRVDGSRSTPFTGSEWMPYLDISSNALQLSLFSTISAATDSVFG